MTESSAMPEGSSSRPTSERIVLSSRVRLARNLKRSTFPGLADVDTLVQVGKEVHQASLKCPELEGSVFHDLERVDPVTRHIWAEAHLISPDFASGERGRFLIKGASDGMSVMVNEEDHLRIQSIIEGFDVDSAWKEADRVDDGLESELDLAYSPRWGYLTACPTNVGTGMRVSLMVHIPALVMTDQAEKLLAALSTMGVVVRGIFGEGSSPAGNVFQISNAATLGRSEADILDQMKAVGAQVVEREMAVRKNILSQERVGLADQTWRAFGILSTARVLGFKEALELTSMVRLGVETGILDRVEPDTLDELWLAIRPAHLERIAGRAVGEGKEETMRAEVVRDLLTDRRGS